MSSRVSIRGDANDADADALSEFEGFGFEFDFEDDDVPIFPSNSSEDKSSSPSQRKKRSAVTPPINDNDDVVNTTKRQAKRLRGSSNSKQTIDNNCEEHLEIGDVVYAAHRHRKTKKRGRSSAVFRRGTVVGVVKKDQRSLSYGIAFGNSQKLKSVDKSLVVSEHRYLHDNLKQVSAIIVFFLTSALCPSVSLIILTTQRIDFHCLQRLEVGQRVVAAWWENAQDTSSPPEGWYPGVIKSVTEKQEGGKFGPDRFYDIKFDDGDKLDDVEDIFVFKECEYELLSRQGREKTSGWKGVRNVLDKDSTDRWAKTVGYWELEKEDGYQQPFPFLGDALRCYDDYIVRCRGADIKRADLNLPEEWVIDSEAKCPPVRCNVQLVNIDTSFLSCGEESAHCASVPAPAPEDTPKTTRRISQCSSDKVLFASTNEYPTKRLFEQNGEAQNSDNAIKRGDNVYVVSRGGNASSNTQLEWLPGRVWDVKVKHELSDSPVKTYDVGEYETPIPICHPNINVSNAPQNLSSL